MRTMMLTIAQYNDLCEPEKFDPCSLWVIYPNRVVHEHEHEQETNEELTEHVENEQETGEQHE